MDFSGLVTAVTAEGADAGQFPPPRPFGDRLGVHPEQGRDLAGCHQLGVLAGAVSCHCCSLPLLGGVWSVLAMTSVLRRLSRSSAVMICVRWPSWLAATHAVPVSRRSSSHWSPNSAMIAASFPVSYPCWRSSRRAATVPAVRTTGGAGGGRRCAVEPWGVLLICHSPPNSPSKVVRLAASSLVMPVVVSGIVIPLGRLDDGAGRSWRGGRGRA